ncbi:MAG: hypothetical protein H6772_00445 [Pseudomonadales bacterium]|nr:hypothetical protein [Pseudomonadales bacterium]
MSKFFNKHKKTVLLEIIVAVLLPLIFYFNVFFGKSFGFECANGVMGGNTPFQQEGIKFNEYCKTMIDPGAYVWQHPPHWMESSRQMFDLKIPKWSQNIGVGFPLVANFQSTVFYLPLMPFSILFSITKNLLFLDLFFVTRYIIASIGMFLFIRSFKISKELSWFAGLSYFSIGYFIYLPNIAHHNVDILIPFIAWGINKLYFNKNPKWIGLTGILLGLSMLGGMPESSIFVLFFVGLYSTFLSFFYLKNNSLKYFLYGLFILLLGLGIGAIIYLPGLEFLSNGVTTHVSGINPKSVSWKNVIFLAMPEFFALRNVSEYLTKIDFHIASVNHVGVIISYLYIICSSTFIFWIKKIKNNSQILILLFFWILSLVLLLQQYGIIHFFFFEKLPVFKQTIFTKYSSSLIGFSMISTVVIFLNQVFKKRNYVLLLSGLFISYAIFFANNYYQDVILSSHYIKKYFGFISANAFYALIIVFIITSILIFLRNKKHIAYILLCLALIEAYIYFPKDGDQMRRDSFREPPSFTYLLNKNYKEFRIFGLDHILFPNLSTIYDLNDIRILDAIWPDRYFYYIKEFFAEPNSLQLTGIREHNATKSANLIDNPYFDLMSVKYIISYGDIESKLINNNIIETFLKNKKNDSNIVASSFQIGNESKNILFQHAPGDDAAKIIKPIGAKFLYLYPAISPGIFNINKGNGVTFAAKVIYDKYIIDFQTVRIDPANNRDDQKWSVMKLGPFPQSDESYSFDLELITDPNGDNSYDQSGWGGFIWDNEQMQINQKYQLINSDLMNIYENKQAVPRLHFVKKTIFIGKNNSDVEYENIIKLMNEYRKEITDIAIVDGINNENQDFDPTQVIISESSFEDNQLSFKYSSSQPQYGVLSDAYYPGWNIYMNGVKGKIDPVNLAFRGFNLPAGHNIKVEMKYEPTVFYIGKIISLISIGTCLIIIFKKNKG